MNKKNIFYIIIVIFIIIFLYFFYNFFIRKTNIENILIEIPKNSSLKEISNIIYLNNLTQNRIFPTSLSILLNFQNNLSYGEYYINNNDTLYDILFKIRKGKSYLRKLTIVEGFQKYQLLELIKSSKLKHDYFEIKEYLIIADTYFYIKNENINSLLKKINRFALDFFNKKNINNIKDIKKIIIISSLVEKEGKDDLDKKLITSVIYNRLEKNMKLDIDATVIYSITKGEYKLNRKLNYSDLKYNSPYNTYKNRGLPPGPICFPGLNTIKIVLEKYKSPYYYYYYDENKNSHIFSKNYNDHIGKLNEYRKNK